nr:outer dense fiber protein 2 [Halyomorpha halys]
MEETKAENNKLRSTVLRLEDLSKSTERKCEGKIQECLQLQSQLETLREESARQVSRIKDRYENMRKTLQGQIFELENQLAATRASAKAAQKDRDDIRQKMQAQIIQLNQNFDQAQMRIRSLQSHVNYLKTSYTSIFCPADKTDSSVILP